MAKKSRIQNVARDLHVVQNPPRVITKSAEFTSIYSNDVQVQTSLWDMRLIFGEIGDPPMPDNPTVNIKLLGELRMSLPLAKRLTLIVVDQLKAYEAQFGEIPLPPA